LVWTGRDRCGDLAAPLILLALQLLLLVWLASCGAPR
jgi:hypothetical protein